MPKYIAVYFSFYLILTSCGQNKSSNRKNNSSSSQYKQDGTMLPEQKIFDTSMIAILPIDTTKSWFPRWLFKDVDSANLTNEEIQEIEILLLSCLKTHNITTDTNSMFSEYIELTKYKRQYVASINSKGEKKVFVNCFCSNDTDFINWEKELVLVDDGGLCFFNVTINLTTLTYEQLYINGFG